MTLRIDTVFDIETTSTDPYDEHGEIFSYCIGNKALKVDVIRGFIDKEKDKKNKLQNYFNNTNKSKICHNFIFELAYCKKHNIEIPDNTIWECTMLMMQVLQNNLPAYKLSVLLENYAQYTIDTCYGTMKSTEIDKKVAFQASLRGGRYDRVDKKLFYFYQVADGQRPMILYKFGLPLLKKDEKSYEIYLKEVAFAKVCERMQSEGLSLHVKNTKVLKAELEEKLDNVVKETYRIYGEYINLGSQPALVRLLYKELKLPILSFTKDKKPSTEKETLFKLQRNSPKYKELIDQIIKYRSYTTGIGNTKNYLERCNKEGIIHPNINSNRASTGRPSCSNPNLLNVAKLNVKKNPFPIPARTCFKCKEDTVIYLVDYAGIQMRLIADACNEEGMLDTINKGGDVHQVPTELLYVDHKTEDGLQINKISLPKDIWKMYRSSGKNCNFAIPFGCGLKQGAETLDISLQKTRTGFDFYRDRFPKVYSFSNTQKEQVLTYGFVQTFSGRKLYMTPDKPYAGANYRIQGDEAEIMKRGMIKVDKYFKTEWNDYLKLILDIYDEIFFSCPISLSEKYENQIIKDVSNLMTSIENVRVRLDVEWKKTLTTWDEAEEIKRDNKKKLKLKLKFKKGEYNK